MCIFHAWTKINTFIHNLNSKCFIRITIYTRLKLRLSVTQTRMDQVYVCIYVVRAGHIFKAFKTQAAFIENQDAACHLGHFTVQQLDSALWCPWGGHVKIKAGNYTFKGNLSCCWRFNSCQGIKSIWASPQTAEVSWITDKIIPIWPGGRFLFSQSWNFRLQASISWRWNQKGYLSLVGKACVTENAFLLIFHI